MMEKIRQQYDIIGTTPSGVEGAARQQRMALGDAGASGILRGDGQHVRPIQRCDAGVGITLRDGDAEQAVARGDIQNAQRLPRISAEQVGQQASRHLHQRSHAPSEVHPNRIVVGNRPFLGNRGPAAAYRVAQTMKRLAQLVRQQEVQRLAEIGRRTAIEKDAGIGGDFILVAVLMEKAQRREIIRQDTHAARRGVAGGRDLGRCLVAGRDGREQVQFERRSQRFGALIGNYRVKEECGGRRIG